MLMHPVLTFDAPVDDELRDALAKAGGRPDSYDTGWQVFSEQERDRAAAALEARGIAYDIRYELAPAPGDPTADLAAYLSLDDLSEIDADPVALVIALDGDAPVVVASAPLVELIAPHTGGLVWDDRPDGLRSLVTAPELPDPVRVPRALSLSEGTDGRWAVQSDGRELLTPDSLAVVRRSGLVLAPACTVDGATRRWRRPPIASGAVLTAIRDRDVHGVMGPPTFLATT